MIFASVLPLEVFSEEYQNKNVAWIVWRSNFQLVHVSSFKSYINDAVFLVIVVALYQGYKS